MLAAAASLGAMAMHDRARGVEEGRAEPLTVFTFGDSVLDCGHYNDRGITPGELLVRNDDALFPEFKGRDLQTLGPTRLLHCALDGATVDSLPAQLPRRPPTNRGIALLTVGGNDLLRGLVSDTGPGVRAFERKLDAFLVSLPVRPVYVGTVYDPTFGDDSRNFLPVPASIARANHRRVNEVIARLAQRHGRLVDLHAHFLLGNPAWFTRTIEPSLLGASEVRRAFLHQVCATCRP
ncbi:SGNH/GDSL hydrolase family protein [Variovorax sp. MHTC-1]|nr:SGNH/GDSL hydrolase family protein [Variovorax sp. MHTC-1]